MNDLREYTEERVSCISAGKIIRGIQVRPAGKKGKMPMVMMFHGFMANRDEQGGIYQRLARELAVQGIASVRFNFAGTGDSDGMFCEMSPLTELKDAENILSYVKGLDFVDTEKIGAMGMSMGGAVCSLLCGRHPEDINAMCLWAPAACMVDDAKDGRVGPDAFDWENSPDYLVIHGNVKVGRIFVDDAKDIDIYGEAARYQKKALLILGEEDDVVDVKYLDKYMDIYKNAEMRTIPGAGHGFFGEQADTICYMTKEFFARELQYSHLFSPLRVGSMILKNRIVAAPITKYGLLPSQADELEFIASRARGGAGLVILGSCAIDDEKSLIYFEGSSLDGPKRMLYQEEISMIHQYGAKVSIQLLHCGMFADMRGRKGNPAGPCTMKREGLYQGLEGVENNQIMDGRTVEGLTREDMDTIIGQYVHSALTAKKMGFDMVMLHFAHGWLMAEFLSPFFNKRTDEYGGSFENRIRFPMEVVKKVREAVGKDYPLDMRIAAEEYVDGGLHPEEVIEFLRRVEDQLDMVHISSGLDKFVEQTSYIESPSLYPHQLNVPFAQMAKKVLHIPVVTVGGINMPDEAEEILAQGKADAIAMGRGFIADPMWPDKARTGHTKDITPCIRCVSCYGVATDGISQGCAVNPCYARELRLQSELSLRKQEAIPGSPKRKNIVVIGGGPAGMKAAVTAAVQGHQVTLLEKSGRLGGLLNISNEDDCKLDMRQYKEHLIHQVLHSDIDLRMNCEATPELVRRMKPDKIIVAVGSQTKKIPIPGIDQEHVMDVVTAHENAHRLGQKIVVIGAGPSGCELALSLAGEGKEVVIVEATDKAAAAGNLIYRGALNVLFRKNDNIKLLLNTGVVKILSDKVLVRDKQGVEKEIPADHVVYSVGMKANKELAESFLGITYDVRMIGDCVAPRRINEAAHEGYFAGLW